MRPPFWTVGAILIAGLFTGTVVTAALNDTQDSGKPEQRDAKAGAAPVLVLQSNDSAFYPLAFSADGILFACVEFPLRTDLKRPTIVQIFDVAKAKRIVEFATAIEFERVTAAVFSPDGKQLVVGCESSPLRMWDSQTGTLTRTFDQTWGLGLGRAWTQGNRTSSP